MLPEWVTVFHYCNIYICQITASLITKTENIKETCEISLPAMLKFVYTSASSSNPINLKSPRNLKMVAISSHRGIASINPQLADLNLFTASLAESSFAEASYLLRNEAASAEKIAVIPRARRANANLYAIMHCVYTLVAKWKGRQCSSFRIYIAPKSHMIHKSVTESSQLVLLVYAMTRPCKWQTNHVGVPNHGSSWSKDLISMKLECT